MTTTRRGYILVQALVVIAGLLALMAMLAADGRVSTQAVQDRLRLRRAEAADDAAVARALAAVQDADPSVVTLNDAWAELGDGGSEEFDVGDAVFRVQVVDAGALVNINTAASEQLERLPFTQDQVHCLLDWRESKTQPRPDGAKDGYYNALPTPYNAKLGPLATTDELLLVKGWTGQTLYQAPPSAASGDLLTDSAGTALPLASLLTVDSGAANTRADGSPRLNLGQPGADPSALTQAGVSADLAMQIAARAPVTSFSALLALPGVDSQTAKTLLDVVTFTNDKRVEGKINLKHSAPGRPADFSRRYTRRGLGHCVPAVGRLPQSERAGEHTGRGPAPPGAARRRLHCRERHLDCPCLWPERRGRGCRRGGRRSARGPRPGADVDSAQHDRHSPLVGLGRAADFDGGCGGCAVRVSRISPSPVHIEWDAGRRPRGQYRHPRDRRGRPSV